MSTQHEQGSNCLAREAIVAINNEILSLLAKTREKPMTEAECEAQAISFAYGNAAFENPLITREMVIRQAELLRAQRGQS